MGYIGLTLDNYKMLIEFFGKTKLIGQKILASTVGVPLKYVGAGAFREVVRLNDNWVLKYPLAHDSIIQNIQEYFISRALPNYFAFCFLYKLNGVPILVCESVERAQDPRDVFGSRVMDDGFYQTGYTKDKRFVCYDAGNENDLLNADGQTMLTAFNEAPELCSYGDLIDRIEADWQKHKVNLPVIPYKDMMSLKDYLTLNGQFK